jgi:hypothetical protein
MSWFWQRTRISVEPVFEKRGTSDSPASVPSIETGNVGGIRFVSMASIECHAFLHMCYGSLEFSPCLAQARIPGEKWDVKG